MSNIETVKANANAILRLNKDGSEKKVQIPMTANRDEYQRLYMREYTANSPHHECIICGGKYKAYQKYSHNKGKFHTLMKEMSDLKANISIAN